MTFGFVDGHRDVWPVRVMCAALQLSASGYYEWRSRPESRQTASNRALVDDIRLSHADRQANSALHIIAIGRLRTDPKTKTYVAKHIAEGHSKLDAIRALKRYIAREVFGVLARRQTEINRTRIAA